MRIRIEELGISLRVNEFLGKLELVDVHISSGIVDR